MHTGSMIRQSLPLLLLLGIGEIAAGGALSSMTKAFVEVPGLITLVPVSIALRGYIGGALGSRMGSAAHLGLITEETIFGRVTRINIKASLLLSLFTSALSGLFAYAVARSFGIAANLYQLVAIALIGGLMAGLILAFLTIGIILLGFKGGLDPDNVISPSIATIGDVLTILCILAAVGLVGGVA